jgi:hypothetical protein
MNPSTPTTPSVPPVPSVPATPDDIQKRLRQAVAEHHRSQKTARGPVTDAISGWLATHYFARAHAELSAPDQSWDLLRACARDFSRFRRDDCAASRLQANRERLANARLKTEAQMEKEFRRWLKRPDIREELFPKKEPGISPETMAKIEKELHLF